MADLIDRQAAIDAVKEYFKFSPLEGRQCAKAIERVPSAQPDKDLIHLQKEQAYMQGYEDGKKSRKGKWIYHTYIPHRKYCSCCKKDSPYDKFWDFCPNCGCCMEEGDSNDNE